MFSEYGSGADATNGEGSIADMLRQAATEVLTAKVPPGFVFIEEYNMYYSHESGYYYDQNTSLFYHSDTQTYYYYDETDGQYKVYQSMKPPEWARRTHRRAAADLLGYRAVEAMDQVDIDVCETLFDMLENLEDEEDRRNRRGRRDQRERDRRSRRDEDDYRRNMERSSRRREVFDGENFVEVDDRRDRHAQDDDWYREKERKSTKEREWDRGKDRVDREDRDRRDKEEKKRMKKEIEDRRRRRSRTWSSSDSEEDKESKEEKKARQEEDERVQMMKEEGYDQPPCVRLINLETLDLFIVTMSGGLVGLAPECDVKVPDQTLPPRLAQLLFVQEKGPESEKKIEDDNVDEFGRLFSSSKRSTRSGSRERRGRGGSRSPSRETGRRRSRSREHSREDRGREGRAEERPGEKAEWRRIEKHVKRRQLPPNASRKERRAFERIWGKIEGDPIHGKYFLRVLSNAAKCTVDGAKVKKGEPDVPIAHGSTVTFAKTNRFTLHIHSGRNTCAGCEPGLLLAAAAAPSQAPPTKKLKGEKARRANLRQMKESFGIEADDEKEPKAKYTDRAKERRKMFGSDPSLPKRRDDRPAGTGGMYDGCAAKPIPGAVPIVTATDAKAAVKKALTSDNKGFKMLKLMGWKEGDGLGKSSGGIVEPIANEFKGDRTGLGAASAAAAALPPTKNAIWESARTRYNKIEESEKKT